jgi:hypothetical protein
MRLAGVLAVALAFQPGCATREAPRAPTQAERDSLGVVAVAAARYPPESKFAISWRHKEGATAKEATLMGSAGLATAAAVAPVPVAGPVLALTAVIATGIMTGVDAARTSRGILPAATTQEVESAIDKAVAALDVQQALAAELATLVKRDRAIRLAPPGTPGIDTVIEVAVATIGFDGCIANNQECRPPHTLHLFMRGQARLVRVADGAVLFEWPLDYASGPHELTRWVADNGRLLGEELALAYRELAERVYDEAFRIAPGLPFVSNLWESRCWLEPLYPGPSFSSRVDSLQPTLRWTAFPREIDRAQLDPSVLRQISGVTYDLRIWDEDPAQRARPWNLQWRNRIFYERTGLAAPQHTLEAPLAPASRFWWSVRARFAMQGKPMATRWMRQSKCFSYDLFLGYYELTTPK